MSDLVKKRGRSAKLKVVPTVEETPKRTRQQINEEFTQCAVRLGDLTFRMKAFPIEIEQLHARMAILNVEVAAPAEAKPQ